MAEIKGDQDGAHEMRPAGPAKTVADCLKFLKQDRAGGGPGGAARGLARAALHYGLAVSRPAATHARTLPFGPGLG